MNWRSAFAAARTLHLATLLTATRKSRTSIMFAALWLSASWVVTAAPTGTSLQYLLLVATPKSARSSSLSFTHTRGNTVAAELNSIGRFAMGIRSDFIYRANVGIAGNPDAVCHVELGHCSTSD